MYQDRVRVVNVNNGAQGDNVIERVAERVVPINSRTDKLMARIALTICVGGLMYGAWALGQPLWWKFYATVVNPFVHDPAHGEDTVHAYELPQASTCIWRVRLQLVLARMGMQAPERKRSSLRTWSKDMPPSFP